MHIVLLSGGSGKRLWPLSNDVCSKQFVRLFRDGKGGTESMIMRAFRCLTAAGDADITVSTAENQGPLLRAQIGEGFRMCREPSRRDTFPAIALACAFLKDGGARDEDPVVVCPADTYAGEDYYRALYTLGALSAGRDSGLALMGIVPTEPATKYGYIVPEDGGAISRVNAFHEKPDREAAGEYIRRGALWNGGIFSFRLGYGLRKARELLGSDRYDELAERFDQLPKISFDHAVVEKEKNIRVMRFEGVWKDIGTWDSLAEIMDAPSVGPALMDDSCRNTQVINRLQIPVVAVGLADEVVCATADGILVMKKSQAEHLKDQMRKLDLFPSGDEKEWGSCQVLDLGKDSLTRKLTLHAGSCVSCRILADEIITVVSGKGLLQNGEAQRSIGPGDAFRLGRGDFRRLTASEDMVLIEVQTGEVLPDDQPDGTPGETGPQHSRGRINEREAE